MITSTDIERAENVLTVIYGEELPRQLEHLQVEGEAIDAVCQHCWRIVQAKYGDAYATLDPRLTAAINTMLVHMFLVGLVSGRHSAREIT